MRALPVFALNLRFQFLWHDRSSSGANYDDAGRRTSTSRNADNVIDDPARSLVGVRLTHIATLAPTAHRHGVDLPSPPRLSAKAGSSMAGSVARYRIGPGGHDLKEDARACVNLLKAKIE